MQAWGPLVILSLLEHHLCSKITKKFLLLGAPLGPLEVGPLVFELKVTLDRYASAARMTEELATLLMLQHLLWHNFCRIREFPLSTFADHLETAYQS